MGRRQTLLKNRICHFLKVQFRKFQIQFPILHNPNSFIMWALKHDTISIYFLPSQIRCAKSKLASISPVASETIIFLLIFILCVKVFCLYLCAARRGHRVP